MAASKTEKDSECLDQDQIRNVQEISLCKCMLQAKAVFKIEIVFGEAKIDHGLDRGDLLVRLQSYSMGKLGISVPIRAYIVILHGGYGCVVDREHQSFIGWA